MSSRMMVSMTLMNTLVSLASCGSAKPASPSTVTISSPTAITTRPPLTVVVTVSPAALTTPVPPTSLNVTNSPGPAAISIDTVDQLEILNTLSGHSNRVSTLAFSGDGTYIASASPDGTIKLWESQSGQEMHTFDINEVGMNDIAFSPDGRLLASAEAIWDAETGQVVHSLDRNVYAPVNEEISRRMVKKQQMPWTQKGAHLLLQIRTRTLNDDRRAAFFRWYPGMTDPADELPLAF